MIVRYIVYSSGKPVERTTTTRIKEHHYKLVQINSLALYL